MENFTKLDCGCHVGFNVNHKPMWGKQCPLHEASKDMYEALRELASLADKQILPLQPSREKAKQALGKAEGK